MCVLSLYVTQWYSQTGKTNSVDEVSKQYDIQLMFFYSILFLRFNDSTAFIFLFLYNHKQLSFE